MCPSKLCSILHELLVGQASKRVRKLGVGFGEGIVNVGLVGTFLVVNGTNWTFLDIGTFGRHSGAEGETLQHPEREASRCMVFICSGGHASWTTRLSGSGVKPRVRSHFGNSRRFGVLPCPR